MRYGRILKRLFISTQKVKFTSKAFFEEKNFKYLIQLHIIYYSRSISKLNICTCFGVNKMWSGDECQFNAKSCQLLKSTSANRILLISKITLHILNTLNYFRAMMQTQYFSFLCDQFLCHNIETLYMDIDFRARLLLIKVKLQ